MSSSKRAESRARYHIRNEAKKRGWSLDHVNSGGNVLEEQEIVDALPGIGLGNTKPDFLFCMAGAPNIVVEAKNDVGKRDQAVNEAIEYADEINETGKYEVKFAVGAAGEKDKGFGSMSRL